MGKKFEQIRDILKPQKYNEIFKTNCFGEFIEGSDMINILDYIRRKNDKINFLETKLQAIENASKLNLGSVSKSALLDEWNRGFNDGCEHMLNTIDTNKV